MDEKETIGIPQSAASGGRKEIDSIRVEPAKNGGHTVRHSYRRKPVHRKGMNGGLDYEYPEADEFVFGPEDGDKMLAHVAHHLGLRKQAPAKEGGK